MHIIRTAVVRIGVGLVLGLALFSRPLAYGATKSSLQPLPKPESGTPLILAAASQLSPWRGPESTAIRARRVELTHSAISGALPSEGSSVALQLFDDVLVLAEVVASSVDVNGTASFTAKTEDSRWGRAVVAVTGGELKARITIPEQQKVYAIEYHRAEQAHYALELDIASDNERNGYNDNTTADAVPLPGTAGHPKRRLREGNGFSATTAVVDVMVVYSNDALTTGGSAAAVANQIAIGMALGNDAHTNTNSGIYLNLVHSEQVNYDGSGERSVDLNRLTAPGDGYLDNVHALRNTHGADFVCLLVGDYTANGGIGWIMNDTDGTEAYAFSVVTWVAFDSYTPVHEIGHNMGLSHARDQNTQPGPTSWYHDGIGFGVSAAGHHWHPIAGEDGYCSVMTYSHESYFSDGLGHTRVGLFSDPNFTDHGMAAGDVIYANNANVLRSLRSVYAAYRDRPIGANVLLVDAPNGGEAWRSETTQYIEWDSNGVSGNVTIDLLKGGVFYSTIAANTENDRLYEWPIPSTLSGDDFQVRITSINEPGISDQSDAAFILAETFYFEPLDTDPGYSTTGGWEYGTPGGDNALFGGCNESSDGSSIYDTNLLGCVFGEADLTTMMAIDCRGFREVRLSFVGWFSVHTGYDAKVQVSNDGATWNDVYSRSGSFWATVWIDYELDISSYASEEPTVYIRWKHENVSGVGNFSGMSVDNIALSGIATGLGDRIFRDGFESGSTLAWSSAVGGS